MEEAGALIEMVQAPLGTLVEEIDGTRLVHGDVSVRVETLILLHSHYPDAASVKDILASLSRRSPGNVRNQLRDLYGGKLAHGNGKSGYRLTHRGYSAAVTEIQKLLARRIGHLSEHVSC